MRTTQGVTAKYTEVYDISTELGENTHYKIHTPTGISHIKKLAGFYKQFKEYKYLGASIAWVPITTLPKDLLGVGYEAGDGVDPRDLINPIMHKGYKGEHLITDYISERTLWSENEDATDENNQGQGSGGVARTPRMTESGGASYQTITEENNITTLMDNLRALYYTSLTDPEWRKSHPREGFLQHLFPVVRTLAATGPISGTAYPQSASRSTPIDDGGSNNSQTNELIVDRDITKASSNRMDASTNITNIADIDKQIRTDGGKITSDLVRGYHPVNMTDVFTHEFERLGWMETSGKGANLGLGTTGNYMDETRSLTDLDINRMPKVYMYLVQTPPAYKTKQFYRMSITHNFAFRKFRQVYGMDMPNIWSDQKVGYLKTLEPAKRQKIISGAKMYDHSGTLHDGDFEIPRYEPALENSIEADGKGTAITKVSDGVA